MPQNKTDRIVWIDALRVFAIVCIIVTHVLRPRLPVPTAVILLMIIGSAALFFMASGALVLPLNKPAGKWLTHRFLAVGVPMLVWGVFYAFIYNVYFPERYDGHPVWQRLLSIFVAQTGSMWFLNVLLGLYLLVPLISPWLRQASRRHVEILLLLWLLTGFYPYLNLFFGIGMQQSPTMSIIGGLYGFFGYFIMGYYFMRWPVKEMSKKQLALIFGALLGCAAVGVVLYGPAIRNDVGYSLLDDLAVNNMAWFSVIFALFSCIPQLRGWGGRAITFCARGVFGAYLANDYVIGCLVLPNIENTALACVAAVTLCFAIGLTLRHIPYIGRYIS